MRRARVPKFGSPVLPPVAKPIIRQVPLKVTGGSGLLILSFPTRTAPPPGMLKSPITKAARNELPGAVPPHSTRPVELDLVILETNAYVPTCPAVLLAIRERVQLFSLPPVANFWAVTLELAIFAVVTALLAMPFVCTLGAPDAPSAIAIGLSRKAKPSIARMGLPGSILSVGIFVHCAILHLTKSTYSLRRSQIHRGCARWHLPTKRLLIARFLWRPHSLAR